MGLFGVFCVWGMAYFEDPWNRRFRKLFLVKAAVKCMVISLKVLTFAGDTLSIQSSNPPVAF